VWWVWVLGALVAWVIVASLAALVIGAMVRLADQRVGITDDAVPAAAPAVVRTPVFARRRVPVPPVGIALAGIGAALMAGGYAIRLSGATGPSAQLMSMDAPYSVPRLFVATMFAAAAMAAVAGAGRIPGRRTWWLAIGAVAAGIAVVKAGSTVHVVALRSLDRVVTPVGGLVVSGLIAAAVIGGLFFLSRTERRDRQRLLFVLGLYGVAAVGLSAVSSALSVAYGAASRWAAAATFIEETVEAMTGVAFLVGVLVGVAPRLVLPAAWALRRAADPHTLDLPEAAPDRTALPGGLR
jgi:hypothetical protein